MDAFPEVDAGRKPELGSRTRRVERPALRVEVHATSIEWRLDSQRHANGLAQQAGSPERPRRPVPSWRFDLELGRHELDQLVERGIARARQDVGATRYTRDLTAQAKPFDEIVDVRQVVEHVP